MMPAPCSRTCWAQRATSAPEHGRRGARTDAGSICAWSGRLRPGRVRAQPPLVEQGDQVLEQQNHNDREQGDDCCVGVVRPPCRQGDTFDSPCRRQMPDARRADAGRAARNSQGWTLPRDVRQGFVKLLMASGNMCLQSKAVARQRRLAHEVIESAMRLAWQ